MRILIAEDDSSIAETLLESLRREGHDVSAVGGGELADAELQLRPFDLLILDLRLPVLSGMEVLTRLRAREQQPGRSRTAVLILTAQDDLRTKVGGLDAGADDYLGKPFQLEELQARVRAILRNRGSALLEFGELSFDPVGRSARLRGAPLELTAREADLLEALIRRPGRLVSKATLMGYLPGNEAEAAGALELYLRRFAKKFDGTNMRLVSVPGLGCSLEKQGA